MSRVEEVGRVLFRIRSFSPVPVIAAILALLLLRPQPPRGAAVQAALWICGVLCCVLGQALRAWVLGYVQEGTSGQNDYLEAVALNTAGPYAHVRNPLYVGNFLICLGLALIAGHALAGALGLGFFVLEYAFIVPAEEGFLRGRFGAAFDAYCARVPRWGWQLQPAPSDQRLRARFDWRRALKKEHNPCCAWLSGMVVLLALQAWMRHGSDALGLVMALGLVELTVLAAYVGIKGWKHRWWNRGRPAGS